VRTMTEFARLLRQIPGYKNIILFSRGIPSPIFDENSTFRQQFSKMGKELSASNSPVYTINSEDITAPEIRDLKGSGGRNSLHFLSELSGGKAYEHVGAINNIKRIAEEIQSLTRNYYVLGYPVQETWDGKFHKIKVRVRQGNYRVQAQAGYFSPKPFSEYSRMEKHLHLLDLALSESPDFQQHLDFPMKALLFLKGNMHQTLFLSDVPVEKLKDIMTSKAEMILLVFDQAKNILHSQRAEIDLDKLPAGKKLYPYFICPMLAGLYDCRLIIRDLATGKGAVAAAAVDVPTGRPGAEPKPATPLLLIPGKTAAFINLSEKSRVAAPETLSLVDIFPFNLGENAPVVGDLPSGVSSLLALLQHPAGKEERGDAEISACLIKGASAEKIFVACSVISRRRQKDGDVFLLDLNIGKLDPGEYALEISVGDPANGAKAQTRLELCIK